MVCLFPCDQEEESSCQWAELHPPLLELILRRLSLADYIRFGSVCKPWLEARRHLGRHGYAEFPMLFLSKILAGRPDDSQLFFSPWDRRCYHIDTRLEGSSVRHVNCIASTLSWLLVHDFFVPANVSKLFLLNPFSGVRIELPDCEGLRYYFGCPTALSSSPTDPSCMIMIAGYLHVMYCRLGDARPRWTKRRIFLQHEDNFIHGIIFLHENQRFYGLTSTYDLVFLDYSMDTPIGTVGLDHSQLEPMRHGIIHPYLAEYMGQILLVRLQHFNHSRARKGNCSPGIHVDVFRADLRGSPSPCWVRVDSLEGGALFVGEGCTGWIPANRAGMCADRIYCSRSRLQLSSRERSDEEEWCWLEYHSWNGRTFLYRPPDEVERRINYSLFWITPIV